LASILEIEGDKTTAEQYYLEDINISKRLKEDRNQMYAQIQLGKFYYANKQYTLAEQVWQEAYEITKTRDYLMGYQREVSAHLLNIAKVNHRDGEELFYRRELDRIDNIIEDRESEDVIRKINWNTSYESITWELEAERNANDRVRYQRLLFMSSTGLLLLLVVVIYFFYKRIIKLQTFKYEAKLLAFQYSKLSSETKLKETHASLASYQVYLSEKTQQIERLEQELEKVKYSTNEYVKEKRPDLEQLLNAHLMTDESWNMFKETFKEEQEEYYLYLMERFPDLTESNLRIVLLQKLGLTNQETANLLGITIDAVKKAKQRLKKKYEEEYDTILNPDKEEV
ncbi:MAG: tetratricopeptide repeat protein, partial [Myroides sp.]|jgi:DNA-binding NarL/FixJ family response regulator|nr:tetratricopeptide repeat protein [Myroides sp.]